MRIMATLKLTLLLALLSLVAGCKLAVIVIQGGEVQSVASGTCMAGDLCIHEITADDFSETFTAVPDSDWAFVRWNAGGDFLCADDTNPVCVVSNVGLGANPAAQAIIDSEKSYHLMPIFAFLGSPVDVINAADGNEWAQPRNFAGVTYNEIAAACPGGVCSGILNGYNVDGWNWAPGPMVAALFNAYFAGACTYPCFDTVITATDFFGDMQSDGFAITQTAVGGFNFEYIDGYSADAAHVSYTGVLSVQGNDCTIVGCFVQAGSGSADGSTGNAGPPEGAWLYR